MENGYIAVPNSPGLGIEVDEGVLRHFLANTKGHVIEVK